MDNYNYQPSEFNFREIPKDFEEPLEFVKNLQEIREKNKKSNKTAKRKFYDSHADFYNDHPEEKIKAHFFDILGTSSRGKRYKMIMDGIPFPTFIKPLNESQKVKFKNTLWKDFVTRIGQKSKNIIRNKKEKGGTGVDESSVLLNYRYPVGGTARHSNDYYSYSYGEGEEEYDDYIDIVLPMVEKKMGAKVFDEGDVKAKKFKPREASMIKKEIGAISDLLKDIV